MMDKRTPNRILRALPCTGTPQFSRAFVPVLSALAASIGLTNACARDTDALSSGNAVKISGTAKPHAGAAGRIGGSGGAAGAPPTTGGTSGDSTATELTGGMAGTQTSEVATTAIGGAGGGGGQDAGAGAPVAGSTGDPPLSPIAEVIDVGPTYSGQPTDMSLTTIGNQQFVAYWGADLRMTVASRFLGEKTWNRIALAPTILHDGHHSIVLAADKKGYLHVSGRMHDSLLTYFRSTVPMNVQTFQKLDRMVGTEESSCTYPRFFAGPIGDLTFVYRYGSSGGGDTIFNTYDASTKTWSRLLGTLFIDGEGTANSAYLVGPTKGPDGYWHVVWTWRENANAESNHDLSYARTLDFKNWETGAGLPLTLPIKLSTADIVDPVPTLGGMINNNTKVGFDSQNRPVVTYHKFDASGATQLYNARVEGGRWVPYQATNWSYRWYFQGMHTLTFEIEVDGVRVHHDGKLKQLYYHAQYGGWGGLLLDETTLAATATIEPPYPYPAELNTVESTTYGMRARWGQDAGTSPDTDIYYMMRWETLDPNGDQARNPEPPPTTLRVYGFRRSVMAQRN